MKDEDIIKEINKLRKEKNAIILAHYYQDSKIQDLADYIGDSLELSKKAKKTDADIILFVGVAFMAETAKILNPNKKVLIPDILAGCSLADNCDAKDLNALKKEHPNHVLITYINCSAEVKAISDIVCTSSNAKKIINSIDKDKGIIFAPDKHLGSYLIKETGRNMILWDGACEIHESFYLKNIINLKNKHKDAHIIAHPECPKEILKLANHIGSTTSLINYVKKSDNVKNFIVITEEGVIHQMKKIAPNKTFLRPEDKESNIVTCHHMRLNTLEKIYNTLKTESPEIKIEESLRQKALIPINKMLNIS